jgi:glycosyltransferase involved in cell wall biosynthesis
VEISYVAQMHVLKKGNRKLYYPAHSLNRPDGAGDLVPEPGCLQPAGRHRAYRQASPDEQRGRPAGTLPGRKKVFLDCDDLEVATSHFSGKWQKWGVALFEDGMPKRVHHVTTHTLLPQRQAAAAGLPAERITYLPNGVDRERFSCPDPTRLERLRDELGLQGKRVVAFIGSLSLPSHPVDLLLEAYKSVRAVFRKACF